MTTALDPAKTSSLITLSNSNRTATRSSGAAAYASSLSEGSDLATVMYAEVAPTAITDAAITVANSAIGDSSDGSINWAGWDANSIGLWGDGNVWFNSVNLATFSPVPDATDVIGVYVDRSGSPQQLWFYNVTKNVWLPDGPGFTITSLGTGPLFLGCTLSASTAKVFNFDGTFAHDLTGDLATRWDGTPVNPVFTTMPAATGAVTLTRFAAGTLYGRKFPAVVNAFTVTRFAAILQRNVPLPAVTRAIVLTGVAVNLVATIPKRLTADAGAVVLSGVAAATTVARKLVATVGAVTLSGSVTALLRALWMAAATGVVTLSGSIATLARGLLLGATTGVVTLTGLAANLIRTTVGNFVLAANAGAVALTGLAANLIRVVIGGATMPAECGTVMLAGMPAVLRIAGGIPETPQPGEMNFGRRVVLWHNRW